MRNIFVRAAGVCVLALAAGLAVFGGGGDRSNITGTWQGALDAGSVKLRLVLRISSAAGGTLIAWLDSVDQRRLGIPINSITQNGSAIRFEMKSPNAIYEGTLSSDGQEMIGEWKQGTTVLPLTFRRTENPFALTRPQEPKQPYPYAEEEVVYENRKDRVTLAGTLTLPPSEKRVPAVVLITGSGSQDRDETVMGHKPFLVLADFLTRRGIAVLRVDDRGVRGSSKGQPTDTGENYADDVLAGVRLLKDRKEIDPKRIGLIGHSEGASIATLAAVKSKDVAFVIMLGGSGLPGDQILDMRITRLMRANGADDQLIDQTRRLQKLLVDYQKLENPKTDDASKTRAKAEKLINEMPEEQRARMSESLMEMITQPAWYRYFVNYDPRPNLRKMRVPVLAVIGENDLQVPSKENLAAIAKALKEGGNRHYKTIELPRLNHHFQTSNTGSPNEYGEIEETFAPAALAVVADWIRLSRLTAINRSVTSQITSANNRLR